MNDYINAQIMNMKLITQTFKQSCQMAAIKNDGQIDKNEEKVLKKINAAAERFIKELDNIK